MKNIILKLMTMIAAVMLLSACDNIANLKNLSVCTDADDFGMPKRYISSKGYNIKGTKESQYSEWFDTGLKLDGERLLIMVSNEKNSKWNPWYLTAKNFGSDPESLPYCLFKDNNIAAVSDERPDYAGIINAPCQLRKGIGLYGLITKPGDNPNKNSVTIIDPEKNLPGSKSFHMGANTPFYDNKESAAGFQATTNSDYIGGNIFFKIMDNNYADNGGSYKVVIKSGAKPQYYNLTSEIMKIVTQGITNVSQKIYNSVIKNNQFIQTIRSLLVLFIIATAFAFIMGLSKMTVNEFIMDAFKIAVVLTLISPGSWNFFYNKFLFVFIDGSVQLMNMMSGRAYSAPGSEGLYTNFAFIDDITNTLISPEIMTKVAAILSPSVTFPKLDQGFDVFVKSLGYYSTNLFFFYALLVVIAIVLMMVVNAVISYLIALMTSTLLICLAPLFIPALLFKESREYFMKWLSQLISFMLQPVILFAFLSFSSNLILAKLKQLLGFKVCLLPLVNFPQDSLLSAFNSLYIFQPVISAYKDKIYVPTTWTRTDGYTCKPYECLQERYVDMPFLDPTNPTDMSSIDAMLTAGQVIEFTGGITLLVWALLLFSLVKVVPQISRGLASGIGDVSNSWSGGMFDKAVNNAASGKHPLNIGGAALQAGAKKLKEKAISYAGKRIKGVIQPGLDKLTKGIKRSIATRMLGEDAANKLLSKDLGGQGLDTKELMTKSLEKTGADAIYETLQKNGVNINKLQGYTSDTEIKKIIDNGGGSDAVLGDISDKVVNKHAGRDANHWEKSSLNVSEKTFDKIQSDTEKELKDLGIKDEQAKELAKNAKESLEKELGEKNQKMIDDGQKKLDQMKIDQFDKDAIKEDKDLVKYIAKQERPDGEGLKNAMNDLAHDKILGAIQEGKSDSEIEYIKLGLNNKYDQYGLNEDNRFNAKNLTDKAHDLAKQDYEEALKRRPTPKPFDSPK